MKRFIVFVLLIFPGLIIAQTGEITGVVSSEHGVLPFVKVTTNGVGAITNDKGEFVLENLAYGTYKLKLHAVGYRLSELEVDLDKPSLALDEITLQPDDLELGTVVVTGTMQETMISKSPVKIEVLTRNFFKSNPVNSIIEALQTVNGVQEQINCGVCGTNDIHINGMEGPYTLVLIDGMPIVSGLSSVYGFNGIPTSLIDRVEIIKGPSSTLYGAEAVGGVINIITKPTDNAPLVDFESRYNTHNELKTSLAFSPRIGKRVFTSISGDYYNAQNRMDFNKDGFTDIPLNNRISLFNKWQINNKSGQKAFSLAARYYSEDRFGGVLDWTPEFRGSDSIYGESIITERFELIGSYNFPVKNRNLKLDFSANSHEQDSYYGDVSYSAIQQVFFSNLIWTKKIKERNQLLLGITNNYRVYSDNTPSNSDENTYVPGLFAQDEFNISDNFTLLGGARLDYHQRHGLIFSPRLNLKKNFGSFTALRFNYGTGFRQVYLFTEDHAFVSGARDILIVDELQPERSHNWTLNLNHTYTALGYGNLDIDLFYTYFSNKIIPDFDSDPNLIIYDNLSGFGTTRGASIAVNHKFNFPLRAKLGATFMDVFEMTEDDEGNQVKEQQIFAPKFSGVFGLSYDLSKIGVSINYNGRVMGPQRLPVFADEFARPEVSEWFTIQNVQITKRFSKNQLEFFGGIKNLFNYTQDSPLIDPENPFGDSFDTAYAYGPLQVRRFFFGLRFNLNRKPLTKDGNTVSIPASSGL